MPYPSFLVLCVLGVVSEEYAHAVRLMSLPESTVKPVKARNGVFKAVLAGAPDSFVVSMYYTV